MNIVFVFCKDQLLYAAKYVFENNRSIISRTEDNILRSIKDSVRKLAKENIEIILKERKLQIKTSDWHTFTGTMGYIILMTLEEEHEDEIQLSIDILVDPALGKEKTFITEEFDSELLLS